MLKTKPVFLPFSRILLRGVAGFIPGWLRWG